MKTMRKVAILALAAVGVALAMPRASASCAQARLIAGCDGICAYVSSPGQHTIGPTGSLRGSFWAFGAGDPLVGVGIDNGSSVSGGNPNSNDDWLKNYFGQSLPYIAASWGNGGVDDCIDSGVVPQPRRTVILLDDAEAAAPGSRGYFLLLCKEVTALTANYDVYRLGTLGTASLPLTEIPYPRLLATSRVPGVSVTAVVKNAAADIVGGVLADPSCPALIRGYKLYTQVRSNASGEPTSRAKASGWTQQGTEIPTGSNSPPLTVSCGNATSVYLATGLVYDNGFETTKVSRHVRMPCDATIADRPPNFRLIRKPADIRRQ